MINQDGYVVTFKDGDKWLVLPNGTVKRIEPPEEVDHIPGFKEVVDQLDELIIR
jgi:hypothetical protein